MNFLGINWLDLLIGIPATLIALSFHEFAHGWVSSKLGDPTPNMQGRLTLNPFAHLDIVGTIMMVIFKFGWAKPVNINPNYYRNPKRDMALTALAGPMMNFLLALVTMIICMPLYLISYKHGLPTLAMFIKYLMDAFVLRNLCFMLFNFIPLPPLDGFKVLGLFLPDSTYYRVLQYERYVMILVMVLCLSGSFSRFLSVSVVSLANLLYNLFGSVWSMILF